MALEKEFEEYIKHSFNNIKTSISGLYKNQDAQEAEMQQVLKQLSALQKGFDDIKMKIDGNEGLDITGLRKRVLYLETRDKWLKNKWMYAVGAVGGISIMYGLIKVVDFLLTAYHNLYFKK